MASGFLLDTWEGKQGRSALKARLVEAGWNQLPLEAHYPGADVAWLTSHHPPKRFAAQIKQVWDLVGSWFDGRLQRQLYDLCRSVDIPALILDGVPFYDKRTGGMHTWYGAVTRHNRPVSYATYTHIMSELTGSRDGLHFHLIPLPGDLDYLIMWLTELGPKRFDSEDFKGWSRLELPPRHTDRRLQALLGTEGLGALRASNLLQMYGTPKEALDALLTGEAMKMVGSIGKTTTEKARKVWLENSG